MQCVYCKDELLQQATVCRSCGRRQPLTADEKLRRWLIAGASLGGLAIVIGVVWLIWSSHARNAKVEQLAARAQLCGHPEYTVNSINAEIDSLTEKGVDWWMAEKIVEYDVSCGLAPRE
jgi:hypothetical protein